MYDELNPDNIRELSSGRISENDPDEITFHGFD